MPSPRVSRRTVLRAGALGAVAATVPVGAIEILTDRLMPVNTWSMGQFSKLAGSTFEVGAARTALTLVQVTGMPAAYAPARAGHQQYTMTFAGPRSPHLADTQVVRHPSLAMFSMFLVDGGVHDGAQHYVVTVNRL